MTLRTPNEPDRVRRYSSDAQNRRLDRETRERVLACADQPAESIERRLQELRCEWSVERYLQLNAAVVGLTTALLAVTHDRRWGIATCAALGFFLFHAIEGFDPPLPLLRRAGRRTRAEIERELYALKTMRGDFDAAPQPGEAVQEEDAQAAFEAVGLETR